MKNNKIAVLGGGHGGHTMAGDFALRGFKVRMFETEEFFDRLGDLPTIRQIQLSGRISGTAKLKLVTSDVAVAIDGAKYIVVVTPSYAHESLARLLEGKVKKDQCSLDLK